MQPLKKVFVVFKTHFDVGYTHLAREVVAWYGDGMIRDALEIISATAGEEQGRKYVWTVPSWPMKKILKGVLEPELKQQVDQAILNGQLIWHALPFTTHTDLCSPEEFIRGLMIGEKLGRDYGKSVHDAKMTDVPGHSWLLPSLLHKAGVKFLHLGSNFCSTPPDVPRLFWWEGPDGCRLLTYYAKGGYGSDLIPPEDWEHPYWLAMLQTLDNQGVQSEDYIKQLFKRAQQELPGVEVSIGRLEDFADAMLELQPDLPVVRGDLSDSWIRGVGSAPVGVSRMRALRFHLQTAEATLSVLSTLKGEYKSLEKQAVEDAYENLLLFAEHTWSMDSKVTILPERYYGAPWIGFLFWESGVFDKALFDRLRQTDPGYQKLQQSWDEQLGYLETAGDNILRLYNSSQKKIPKKEDTITVFSTLGLETTVQVCLEKVIDEGKEDEYILQDCEGALHPVYRSPAGKLCSNLLLSPLGAKSYMLKQASAPDLNPVIDCAEGSLASRCKCGGILENDFIRVEIDATAGGIRSFFHKKAGKEWVNPQTAGFGHYQYDVYSNSELKKYLEDYAYVFRDWAINDLGKAGYPREQGHELFIPEDFDVHIVNETHWASITLKKQIDNQSVLRYGNAKAIEIRFLIYQDSGFLDVEYRLLDKQPTPFIESGHFVFPLQAENPRYYLNKLGCVLSPEEDIVQDGNKNLHCLESWTAVEDGGNGFAIFPKDMPLLSYVTPGVLRFDREFKITEPTIFMQGFNNAWGTNFPQWSEGDFSFSYRLFPYVGSWKEADVWRNALAYTQTPLAYHGAIPCSLLESELPGMRILGLKPAEDGNGFVLRIADIWGEASQREICFATPLKTLFTCTHTEEKQSLVKIEQGNCIRIHSNPYEIHTLYFELA